MFRIIYVSTATRALLEDELSRMLEDARARNFASDVTGMLVFSGGDFLQVLEGETSEVTATFDRIAKDVRHAGVTVLQRGMGYGSRLFAAWTMGFKAIADGGPGLLRLNQRIDLRQLDEISALDFLKSAAHESNRMGRPLDER